jgi:hypothetical protein
LEYHDLNNFTEAGGKLYFIDSTQLWVSDGTDTGTHVIIDPSNITSVNSLAVAGNKLFYDGNSYNYGDELYVNDGTNNFFQQNNSIAKKLNRPAFNAKLLANPFINNIGLNINSPQKQELQITVSTITGQTLISKTINVNTGNNLITLDAAKYAHGIYTVNISSASGTINLKAIK